MAALGLHHSTESAFGISAFSIRNWTLKIFYHLLKLCNYESIRGVTCVTKLAEILMSTTAQGNLSLVRQSNHRRVLVHYQMTLQKAHFGLHCLRKANNFQLPIP